jgi:cytochrome c
MKTPGPSVVLMVAMTCLGSSQASELVDSGKELFKRACATCHSVEKGQEHRQGPNLWAVLGRPAGQSLGFAYSVAFKDTKIVWDVESIDKWLADPQEVLPGNVMTYAQRNPERREMIIEYLKTMR